MLTDVGVDCPGAATDIVLKVVDAENPVPARVTVSPGDTMPGFIISEAKPWPTPILGMTPKPIGRDLNSPVLDCAVSCRGYGLGGVVPVVTIWIEVLSDSPVPGSRVFDVAALPSKRRLIPGGRPSIFIVTAGES